MKNLITFACFLSLVLAGCSRGPSPEEIRLQNEITELQNKNSAMALTISNLALKEATDITNCIGAAETLDKISRAEAAGVISADKAKFLRGIVTGKIPLYVGPGGQMTTNQYSAAPSEDFPAPQTQAHAQAQSDGEIPADVDAKIRADAEQQFPGDYVMQKGAIESQEAAYKSLHQ